jgi:PTS system N-acetylgalactosamine-specific IIA component
MSNPAGDAAGGAVRAIVAGHGDFAAGLISAVEQITGRGDQFLPMAVTGLGAEDIERVLRERMLATGIRVVFTDLQAGSCTMAARRVLRGMSDAVVVCGTNLPLLLDFAFNDRGSAVDAARHAADRGRAAIALVGTNA